jgi:uncharacterized protein
MASAKSAAEPCFSRPISETSFTAPLIYHAMSANHLRMDSFDRAKASHPVESAICSDQSLSNRDVDKTRRRSK